MKKRILSLTLALVMTMSLLPGCGSTGQTGGSSKSAADSGGTAPVEAGGVLNLAFSEDIDTLNPHMERSSTDSEIILSVGGVLYRIAPSDSAAYQIIPEYAAGAPEQMDSEGKVWRIKIREDAKYADGSKMTAEDFVYSIKMYYDPLLLNAPGTTLDEYGVYITNAAAYITQKADGTEVLWEDVGVKLAEDNALELTLDKPVNASQIELAFATSIMVPVKEELYEAGMNADRSETNYGSSWDKFASSGPFQITGWVRDSEITMERNPNYPLQDMLTLSGITYKIVPEAGTQVQLFESGQLDMVTLSEADLERYGEDPRILEVPSAAAICIGLNMIHEENPILQNQKFRRALFLGTNRKEAAKLSSHLPVDYYITNSYILDINTGLSFRDSQQGQSYVDPVNFSYDPEQAKQLMDEALQEAGLSHAALEILYQDSSASRKKVCEYLQSSWQELFGSDKLTVTLQAVPSQQLSQRYRSHTDDPNAFEAGIIASSYNVLDPASALMEWNMNATRKKIPYYDETFTALYDEAVALPLEDIEGRAAKIAQAEARMLEDAPFIPITQSISSALVAERVTLPYTTYNSILRYAWPWARISG